MNVLNDLPLDEPIYRYMKLNHFENALRNKELVLVNPTLWDDPYELIPDSIWVDDGHGNIKGRIQSCLRCCFCLCWSHRGQSDTLLQAYSRVKKDSQFRNEYRGLEGVHIRTTPRKLIAVIEAATSTCPHLESSIGRVRYGKHETIKSYVASLLRRDREILMSHEGIVEVLLCKREAFKDEGEVRLICIQKDGSENDTLRIPFDPNELFESIAFDPRLWTQERNEHEASAREAGYTGEVLDSGFYHRTMWVIPENSLT